MNKEKEIEEMVDVLWGHCGNLINEYCEGESHCANCIAKKLTDAGYRKADEVRKETAREIKNLVNSFLQEVIFDEEIPNELSNRLVWHFEKLKKHIEKRYGVEVDE